MSLVSRSANLSYPVVYAASTAIPLHLNSMENNSMIDYSIPGNRLAELPDGSLTLIPKTPAEIIGEKVLRPMIDVSITICHYSFSLLKQGFISLDSVVSQVFNFLPQAEAAVLTNSSQISNEALYSSTEAAMSYLKAAEQGDIDAQYEVGVCYSFGLGVTQNYTKAVEWYQKASKQGDTFAQFNLAFCYQHGLGVDQDYSKAVEWYQKAAVQGEVRSQLHLGLCYQNSLGVAQDYTKAIEWYQKAAEQGESLAYHNLGVCYHHGLGVAQDHGKAVALYQIAAAHGSTQSQVNLGICYEQGIGVVQDFAKAVEWYQKAAAQGDSTAKSKLKSMQTSDNS